MLKKEITYTDFDGKKKTEDFYFNLTKAELIEYDAAYQDHGGVMEYLTSLMKHEQTGKLIMAFKDLILRSYGERTSNGKFVKSQELRDAFMATEAYSELFLEITSGEDAAAAFINGIIPQVSDKPNNVTPIPAPVG